MKRKRFESFLGKEVAIILKDFETVQGVLVKGDGYENNLYTCDYAEKDYRFWFRLSHVTIIKETPK